MQIHTRLGAAVLACAGLLLVGACEEGAAGPTGIEGAHANGIALSAAGLASNNPELARQLADLKQFSVRYHNLENGKADYPVAFIAPPLTTPDGCISDENEGGMGYHYAGRFPVDGSVNYLEPELLVYAPKKGPKADADGQPRVRFAAFDYFIPFTAWPETDPAPTSADLGLAINPPIEFAPSRFGGWMFHIWPWHHNPDGMFANWNSAVPLCEGSEF